MADDPQPQSGPSLSIQKIYVKDLSLENPGAPQSFFMQEPPQVEVGLRTRGEQIEQDVYECVLTVTVTAKIGDKVLFLVEECAVSLHPGDHRRCDYAGSFSARPPRPHQFRAFVSAAARKPSAAAGGVAGSQLRLPCSRVRLHSRRRSSFSRPALSARSFIPHRSRLSSTMRRRSGPSPCSCWAVKCRSKSSSRSRAGTRSAMRPAAWHGWKKKPPPTGAPSWSGRLRPTS